MSENEMPEGLGDFIEQVFGSTDKADEFSKSLDDSAMREAWKGIYEVYMGMRGGGFSAPQANAIMGSYLYHLISGIEGGSI